MFTEYTLCTPVRFPNLFTLFQALVSVRVVFRATSSVPSNKFNLPTCLDIVVILHTHVVSQPASLILASSMISFLRKSLTFPNFHNFRSTVSIFPTKRKKNLRKTNKWINKYISSSFLNLSDLCVLDDFFFLRKSSLIFIISYQPYRFFQQKERKTYVKRINE